jgi:hypothetical protein
MGLGISATGGRLKHHRREAWLADQDISLVCKTGRTRISPNWQRLFSPHPHLISQIVPRIPSTRLCTTMQIMHDDFFLGLIQILVSLHLSCQLQGWACSGLTLYSPDNDRSLAALVVAFPVRKPGGHLTNMEQRLQVYTSIQNHHSCAAYSFETMESGEGFHSFYA